MSVEPYSGWREPTIRRLLLSAKDVYEVRKHLAVLSHMAVEEGFEDMVEVLDDIAPLIDELEEAYAETIRSAMEKAPRLYEKVKRELVRRRRYLKEYIEEYEKGVEEEEEEEFIE